MRRILKHIHSRYFFSLFLLTVGILIGSLACNSGALPEPSPIPPPPNLDEITPIAAETSDDESNVDEADNALESEEPAENNEEEATPIAEEEATTPPEPTPTLAPTAVPQTDPPIQSVRCPRQHLHQW